VPPAVGRDSPPPASARRHTVWTANFHRRPTPTIVPIAPGAGLARPPLRHATSLDRPTSNRRATCPRSCPRCRRGGPCAARPRCVTPHRLDRQHLTGRATRRSCPRAVGAGLAPARPCCHATRVWTGNHWRARHMLHGMVPLHRGRSHRVESDHVVACVPPCPARTTRRIHQRGGRAASEAAPYGARGHVREGWDLVTPVMHVVTRRIASETGDAYRHRRPRPAEGCMRRVRPPQTARPTARGARWAICLARFDPNWQGG
jgi:hypothetical protein